MTLAVTTTHLPSATVGTAYSQTLTASGGTTPYTWAVTSGALPVGLSLNASTGVISGTPTTASTPAAVQFTVTDSATPTPATANATFTFGTSGTVIPIGSAAVIYGRIPSFPLMPQCWPLTQGSQTGLLNGISATNPNAGTLHQTALTQVGENNDRLV
jgi:Putative Ig domain